MLRSLGVAAGVGLVGATQTSAVTDDRTGGTWGQYSADAANTGYSPDAAGITGNVSRKWQYTTEDTTSENGYSAPVVADGTVYVSSHNSLLALDAADGTVEWMQTEYVDQDRGYSVPAVADGTVYVGLNYDQEGCSFTGGGDAVIAYDAATGDEQWRYELPPPEYGDDPTHSFRAPTVADGTVYVVEGATMESDGHLIALDAADGSKQWRYNTGGTGSSGFRAPSVAAVGDTVYLAADEMAALDAATGEPRWSNDTYRMKNWRNSAPAVVDGTVYGATDPSGTVYGATDPDEVPAIIAFDATTGDREWVFKSGEDYGYGDWSSPAVHDGTVYAAYQDQTGSEDAPSQVVALDAADGSAQWIRDVENSDLDLALFTHAPAVAGGVVYLRNGALDATDGTTLWSSEDDVPSWLTTVAVVGDTIYTGGDAVTALTGDTR